MTSRRLLHDVVELDLRLRAFERAGVAHDFLVRLAVAIGVDRGLRLPFRIGDEFGGILAAQQLFRHAAVLLNHQRRAFRFPDEDGIFALGGIDLDVDEADDRHGRSPGRMRTSAPAAIYEQYNPAGTVRNHLPKSRDAVFLYETSAFRTRAATHRPPRTRPNKRVICLSRIAEQRTRAVDVPPQASRCSGRHNGNWRPILNVEAREGATRRQAVARGRV